VANKCIQKGCPNNASNSSRFGNCPDHIGTDPPGFTVHLDEGPIDCPWSECSHLSIPGVRCCICYPLTKIETSAIGFKMDKGDMVFRHVEGVEVSLRYLACPHKPTWAHAKYSGRCNECYPFTQGELKMIADAIAGIETKKEDNMDQTKPYQAQVQESIANARISNKAYPSNGPSNGPSEVSLQDQIAETNQLLRVLVERDLHKMEPKSNMFSAALRDTGQIVKMQVQRSAYREALKIGTGLLSTHLKKTLGSDHIVIGFLEGTWGIGVQAMVFGFILPIIVDNLGLDFNLRNKLMDASFYFRTIGAEELVSPAIAAIAEPLKDGLIAMAAALPEPAAVGKLSDGSK